MTRQYDADGLTPEAHALLARMRPHAAATRAHALSSLAAFMVAHFPAEAERLAVVLEEAAEARSPAGEDDAVAALALRVQLQMAEDERHRPPPSSPGTP